MPTTTPRAAALLVPALALLFFGAGCGSTAADLSDGPSGVGSDVADGAEIDAALPDGALPDGARPDAGGGGDGADDDTSGRADTRGDGGAGADAGGDGGGDDGSPFVPGGDRCRSNAECGPGLICETRFGQPYCAPAPNGIGVACSDDDDCRFADVEEVFCCTDFARQRVCARAGLRAEGATCGEGLGRQGDSCSDGGQSDCRGEDHICVFGERPYAYCSQFCEVRDEDACPEGTYCRADGDNPVGICLAFGDRDTLQPCVDDPLACEIDHFCFERRDGDAMAFCAEFCASDFDCGDDEYCTDFRICSPIGERSIGETCVEDRFSCGEGLICINDGTRVARCSRICRGDRECPEDFECQLFDRVQGVCTEIGGRETGEYCGDDPLACDGFCTGGYAGYDPNAWCIGECFNDDDCPDSAACQAFPTGSFCVAAGDAGQGESCAGDPLACAPGHTCLDAGLPSAFCVQGCTVDEDCPGDTWCANPSGAGGTCLPNGELEIGASCADDRFACQAGSICGGNGADPRCFTTCTDDESRCPTGQTCLEPNENGVRWCYFDSRGEYGQSCEDDRYSCEWPLFCQDAGEAPARCTQRCDADRDCPGDDWCLLTGPDGICWPGDGDGGRFDSCQGDAYGCEAGLACILGGARGAFCAEPCTGFADRCGDDEACRYIGFGVNVCVQTGDAEHGDSCADDQFACDADHWCVNAGTDDATCVQSCSFDSGSCPDGTRCRFLGGGMAVCISAGLSPEDPLNPGGLPF